MIYRFIVLFIFITLPICKSTLSADSIKKNWSAVKSDQLLIISTIDGKISALDIKQNGKLLWSTDLNDGPLISSSITKLVFEQDGKTVRLIPSLHGGLYRFDGDAVEAVPFDADQLLKSSFRLADNTVLIGGKETCFSGLDLASGKILYTCSVKGCEQQYKTKDSNDVIVIKRLQQTVRSIENRNGNENWNFSVSELEIDYSKGSDNLLLTSEKSIQADFVEEPQPNCDQSDHRFDMSDISRIKFVVPDGTVCMVTQKNNQLVLWKHSFQSAVTSAWVLFEDRLHKLDMFDGGKIPALDNDVKSLTRSPGVIYMGNYEKQVYIQASPTVRRAISQAISPNFQNAVGHIKYNPPRFTHRPCVTSSKYLMLSSSSDAVGQKDLSFVASSGAAAGEIGKHLLLCHDDSKSDKGLYFQGDLSIYSRIQTSNRKGRHTLTTSVNVVSPKEKSVTYYTIHILLMSLAIMIFVPYVIYRYVYALYFKSDSSSIQSHTYDASYNFNEIFTDYNSRFLQDFEPEKCLGRGGFGVVFKARNKMDDHSYAVKRIQLPRNDAARDKVLREVRVLAQLDHPSIVRYFNSWSEQPPGGWQGSKDKMLFKGLSVWNSATDHTEERVDRKHLESSNENDGFASIGFDYEISESNYKSRNLSSAFVKDISGYSACLGTQSLSWADINEKPETVENLRGKFYQSSNNSYSACSSPDVSNLPFANYRNDSVSVVFDEQAQHSLEMIRYKQASNQSSVTDPATTHFDASISDDRRTSKNEQTVYLYIQMQLCKEESLKEWLTLNRNCRSSGECVKIFHQVVNAVIYIHEQDLIHRDLKPSNVLFSLDGTIKVGDFGLVTSVGEPSAGAYSGDIATRQHTRQVGTMLYMAPEQMESGNYTAKVDIFALGLIFFELFQSFDTNMEKVKHFADVRRKKFPIGFLANHHQEAELITTMLMRDPDDRPTAKELSEQVSSLNFV